MVRCDEFYAKWEKVGNFCEKHPRTAERIETYLDEILKTLSEEVARSEILKQEFMPNGTEPTTLDTDENVGRGAKTTKDKDTIRIYDVLTEGASRPILSEPKEKRHDIIKEIVKAAEEKVIDDKEPRVTEREVREIICSMREAPKQKEHKSQFNQTNDNIEWARWSWNPVTGCKNNCKYCYARDIANRFFKEKFEPTFKPERLDAPKNTLVPSIAEKDIGYKNVFVCSMADLFGDWVQQEWINAILESVRSNPQWNFLFLTKNPKRLIEIDWPQNTWVGVTVDTQARVNQATSALEKTNAPIKFVSCEPLLEPIKFDKMPFDWLIIGSRSQTSTGPEFMPDRKWVYELELQAMEAGVMIYEKPNLKLGRLREYPDCG